MQSKVKYYKLNEARPNLSKMINSVGESTSAYIIGNRNKPKAVLIDVKTANKYLPEDYNYTYSTSITSQTDGEIFYKVAMKLLKKKRLLKTPKLKLSDVDKFVYGI